MDRMTPVETAALTVSPSARTRTTPETPTATLGAWQTGTRIASGAFCDLFEAWPAGRKCASPAPYLLKLLREDCRRDPQAQSLLAREMEVANSVSNPHLISILEGRRESGQSYLVLPYLKGCSLAAALAEEEPLPLHLLLWLARQATQGLQALHEAGWIHGDIKPANLFVSPQAHLTILDLGLAERAGPAHLVTERTVRGTPAYLAPEALSQRSNVDARSDLYSLGSVIYEMITLRRLFAGESARDVIDQQRRSPTPDPRAISSNAPRALAELVRSLLAKEPLRRPESAAEVLDQLVRIEIQAFAETWNGF